MQSVADAEPDAETITIAVIKMANILDAIEIPGI